MGVTGINVQDFQARDVIKYASLTVIEKWQWKLYLAESDVIKYASLTVIEKWQWKLYLAESDVIT